MGPLAAVTAGDGMKHWVVCYDVGIERARARRKVARLLDGYGQRAQYSVFEVKLTESEYRRLFEKLLDLKSDHLIIHLLTPSALEASVYPGRGRPV